MRPVVPVNIELMILEMTHSVSGMLNQMGVQWTSNLALKSLSDGYQTTSVWRPFQSFIIQVAKAKHCTLNSEAAGDFWSLFGWPLMVSSSGFEKRTWVCINTIVKHLVGMDHGSSEPLCHL